jgi:hypothetical protein
VPPGLVPGPTLRNGERTVRFHLRYEDMTAEEKARRFRYFTYEQLVASIAYHGLPDRCDDPDTLRAAAAIEAVGMRERAEREREAASGP